MRKTLMLLIAGLLLFAPQWVHAQEDDDEEETDTFAEITKDATHRSGFIDSYQKDGELYLAITPDMLNKDFLMKYEIAQGIGSSSLFGGTMLNIFEGSLVALEKHDGKIFLVKKPHRYVAKEESPEQNAIKLSYGSSVLETAKIEATNDDSVMLINAYDWFVSDLSQVSDRVKYAVSSSPGKPGRASLDKGRSYLKGVKSFPENTNVTAMLTFANAEDNAPRTVPDERYIPVGIHYTLAALPEQPMQTRQGDDRVGYFMTVHKDFSSDDETDFFARFVNRWRLECTEETAGNDLCEPKKPITYYIDHTVPERYREAMMDGVESWSDAFEQAGFRNAVRAEMLPDNAEPEDIRYPTLRWNTSDQPGYGAIGPSVVDPRTGEILDADILFEANMVLGFKNSWRNLVDPNTTLETIFNVGEQELANLKEGGEMPNLGAMISNQGMFLRSALIARGEIGPNQPVPDEYVNQVLKWVTMHEIGHTLGLRHNFRSSVDTPIDKLFDKQWAEQNGVFGSVMEYPTPNIAPEGTEPGYYYNPGVGSYDRWVISYGYTPDSEQAKEIARQGALDGHAYGTDEDARGPGAVDPTINVYDLSDDPLAWGKQRVEIARNMMPKLPDITLADNVPYYRVTELFQNTMGQYFIGLSTGIKYIGGQYQYRDHVGDPQARGPFVAVEKAKQEEALNFIIEYGFSEKAMAFPQDVYQKFGADRWSHWGNNNTYGGRIDYPIHQTVLSMQSSFLNQLINPYRLSRIRDSEMKFGAENVVGIPQLMDELKNAIWSEVLQAPGKNITSNRRDLQRAHLDQMVSLLTNAPGSLPADARSVVRMQLKELDSELGSRLAPPTFDFNDYTRAHLEESKARIEAALAAGLELEN
jgi:hypothetical protein